MNSNSTDIKDIRKFGIVAFLFFGALFAAGIWLRKPIPIYLFGFLSILGFALIIAPAYLKPVYENWLKVSSFLGKLLTTILLSLAYYLVITPSAFLKRIFGGTPLPTKPQKEVQSYWVERSEPVQPKERFNKRY